MPFNRRQKELPKFFVCGDKCEVKPGQVINSLWIAGIVSALVAQPVRSQGVQVTQVQLNPTDNGLEVILKTTSGKPLQVLTSSYGKTFVANIINTQLALPGGNSFRSDNPTTGITAVTVTQQGANSIRVTVIGTASVPTARVIQSDSRGAAIAERSLVLSLTAPDDTTADLPTPTPETPDSDRTQEPAQQVEPETPDSEPGSETQPAQEPVAEEDDTTKEPAPTTSPTQTTEEDEQIEIVVTGELESQYSVPNATTGTRTDTPIRDIPQSIQVVPEQVLEDQQVIRVGDALQNVSGVVNQEGGYSGYEDLITIRGFVADAFQGNYFRE